MSSQLTKDQPNQRRRKAIIAAVVGLLALRLSVPLNLMAHEGHAPLPTKGAQVDVAKGSLILSKDSRDALGVQSAEVTLRLQEERVLAYATLVAPWKQHAYATTRIAGRIVKLYVQPGQHVVAGQPLADVQSSELDNLQLELINAQNDILLSDKLLMNLRSLSNDQVIPGRELYAIESRHQENLNALEAARIKLLGLGVTQSTIVQLLKTPSTHVIKSLPILSPITGTIIHADLTVGKIVQPTEHLFEIVDVSKVWGKINVLESDLHTVDLNQAVQIVLTAYPSEVFRGVVQVKQPYLDPVTHLGTVWTELQNPANQEPRLLPGMFGQAQVIVASANKMLTIPASALIRDGAERYVLVEEAVTAKASEYQKRNIVVTGQTAEYVQFKADSVYAGDRVVTTGSHELFNFFVQGVLRLSPEARKNIGLRVEPVAPRAVEDVIEVEGKVDVPADHRDFASSQLQGTIQTIQVERGQLVRAGDVLAEIASLKLQDLQMDLLRAHLQLELLDNTLQRLRKLNESLIVARRQLWETESLYAATRNRRENLERQLVTIGLSPEQVEGILNEKKLVESLPLRATIHGVVVHFDKVLGQIVQENEPLFEVHDLSKAWVQGFVSERDLARVRIGQRARVRLVAYPDYVADGKVVRTGQVLGAEDRTRAVWLELSKPPPFVMQHNMLARLSLSVGDNTPSLAVPLEALVREGTRSFVFVQQPDGRFDRRAVETGRFDDRFAEILGGLREQEQVAVWGTAELQTAYASLK